MNLFEIEERIKRLPVSLLLNPNTISANKINLFYEIEKDEQAGVIRIDLHGYSVVKAQEYVNRVINFFCSNRYYSSIFFITGRGNSDTIFKLFPQWLKDDNISQMIEKCESSQIGTYEVILKTSENKNPESSLALKFEVLYSLAEMGLSSYQFYLGVKYHRIKKDDKEAAKWFLKAAEQGLSSAQLMLGFLYKMGTGVRCDSQQALHWYHMAARQNNPTAMRNIAYHHLCEKDYQNAIDWFLRAFEAGEADSANQIATMYKFGIGTSCDRQKAGEWYRKAAEAGDNHGKVNLGTHLLESDNKGEGMKWIREAATGGLANAQMHLGVAYLRGDVDEAKKWLLKSAMQDASECSGYAQYFLGFLTENSEQKLIWYQKAADNDVKIAQKELANIYRLKDWGLKDEAKAFMLYSAAAKDTNYNEKGVPSAQYILGECYELGLLKENKNPNKALKWYKEAAKQGYPQALKRLGFTQENNLTLTQIQERLKEICTLPRPEELEKLDILMYIGVYIYKTSERYITLKRTTDELSDIDEILGYMYQHKDDAAMLQSDVVREPPTIEKSRTFFILYQFMIF